MDYFADSIKNAIRTVPDWPKPGVAFRDITTVLQDRTAFRGGCVCSPMINDAVAAIDARGFIIGAPLAYELNAGLVLVRKKGKLPFDTLVEDYELEYGTASVELHKDAFKPGDKVVLVDDLIATGGTMRQPPDSPDRRGNRGSLRDDRPAGSGRVPQASG